MYKRMFDDIERSSENVEKMDTRLEKHYESFEYIRNYDDFLKLDLK